MTKSLALLVLLSAPAACARLPDLGGEGSAAALAAPYPALQPLDTLTGAAAAPAQDPSSDLQAQAAALKARADAL